MPKIYYDSQGFPVYDKDDGWKDHGEFQAAALNEMAKRQPVTPPTNQPASPSSGMALAADALPAVGGSLGALVPGLGETGMSEVGGAAAGSIAKTMLRSKFPQTFGENPQGGMAQAGDSLSDTVLGALPGLGKAMGRVSAGVAGMTGTTIGKQIAAHINDVMNGLHGMHPKAIEAAKDALRSAGIAVKSQ